MHSKKKTQALFAIVASLLALALALVWVPTVSFADEASGDPIEDVDEEGVEEDEPEVDDEPEAGDPVVQVQTPVVQPLSATPTAAPTATTTTVPTTTTTPTTTEGTTTEEQEVEVSASVTYQVHGQSYGWTQGFVSDGAQAGKTGQSKRLEAIQIKLSGLTGITGGITYQVHGQSYGWTQGWKSDGATAGTTGQSKRIEAIQIKLTGDVASYYDVYYRVHVQSYGWLDWAKNGETAGTTGLSKRAEAIEIKLVKKGEAAPGSTSRAYIAKPTITYASHVQSIGWQGFVSNGATSGTTGRSKRIEAMQIKLGLTGLTGGVQYSAHVQSVGWQSWVADGDTAGTTGQSKRMEAVKIQLTGEVAKYFDVYYRVHSQSLGWLGWAKNGEIAGTTGIGYRAEAVQVVLVAKGGAAPGSTSRHYVNTASKDQGMLNKAQGYSSSTNWLLLVNCSSHKVGVYQKSGGKWAERYVWSCGNGAAATPTPKGVFKVASRGYSFGVGFTCYYWTQFSGSYLFHSVLYYQGTHTVQDGRLGVAVSHGCVRLDINNAKWIYDNIPTGTTVVCY